MVSDGLSNDNYFSPSVASSNNATLYLSSNVASAIDDHQPQKKSYAAAHVELRSPLTSEFDLIQ